MSDMDTHLLEENFQFEGNIETHCVVGNHEIWRKKYFLYESFGHIICIHCICMFQLSNHRHNVIYLPKPFADICVCRTFEKIAFFSFFDPFTFLHLFFFCALDVSNTINDKVFSVFFCLVILKRWLSYSLAMRHIYIATKIDLTVFFLFFSLYIVVLPFFHDIIISGSMCVFHTYLMHKTVDERNVF